MEKNKSEGGAGLSAGDRGSLRDDFPQSDKAEPAFGRRQRELEG